ncbi:MAG TPA: hypothetical protein DEB39_06055 [Planctomycetaceae bacterium]|nr:hypothetical protein [Planctomycetaceae bacterium]
MIIRKLTEQDRETVLAYLAAEPAHVTFFVADIRDYGFDDPRFHLWGLPAVEGHEPFEYILCLFYGCVHIYSKSDSADIDAICRFLDENEIDFKMIAGKEAIVSAFSQRIAFQTEHRCYLAELRRENFVPHIDERVSVEWATVKDAEEILQLRANMPEFSDLMMPLEQLVDLLATGKGRVMNIRENDWIVSSATESCMGRIGYVCTDPAFRGRGYASVLVSNLSEVLLNEGIVPSLSYENPTAGSIYRRLGFREIGRTAVLSK